MLCRADNGDWLGRATNDLDGVECAELTAARYCAQERTEHSLGVVSIGLKRNADDDHSCKLQPKEISINGQVVNERNDTKDK